MQKRKKYKIRKLWSIGGYDFYGVRGIYPDNKNVINSLGLHVKEGCKLTGEQKSKVEKDIEKALKEGFKIKVKK